METNHRFETVQLPVTPRVAVTGVLAIPEWWPSGHRVAVVLGHDVGSDMNQDLLVWLQRELVEREFLSIRFNFPFAEEGRKRPDPPGLLDKACRAALQIMMQDPQEAPSKVVLAGAGLGARVAANLIAAGVKADGLFSLAYPLHPAGKPSQQQADALFRIICPILFVQGTRDSHCRIDRLELLLRRVGAPTTLIPVEDANHDLDPIRRSTRSLEEIRGQILHSVLGFLERSTAAQG